MSHLEGKTIAVFFDKLFNEHEFLYPVYRLKEAGAKVIMAATEGEKEYKGEGGLSMKSEKGFSDLKADELDGVVIAGGYGPDKMRVSEDCLRIVKELYDSGKLVAFICHAGWVPASAGILKDKKATSVKNIKDDMIHAGCKWEDAEVVVDGNMISSRTPKDLPAFMREVVAFLGKDGR